MPKRTDLPTNWHSFLSTFHLNPACSKLQNTKSNPAVLLADYLQTPGILEQHITGMGNSVPDMHIQAVQPFWQISSNLHFKHLQKWVLCDSCYSIFSGGWCWDFFWYLGNIVTRHCKKQSDVLSPCSVLCRSVKLNWHEKNHTNTTKKWGGKEQKLNQRDWSHGYQTEEPEQHKVHLSSLSYIT